jgi:hypothetical protein
MSLNVIDNQIGLYDQNPDTDFKSLSETDFPITLECNKRKYPPNPPYKWDLETMRPVISDNKDANSPSELKIRPLKDKSLRTELQRFVILLTWYDKNIPDKYMSTRTIFFRALSEGPKFNLELSKIWKMAQRATFTEYWEKLIEKDYPKLIGSIDYIYDPKCLPRWELPDEKDYKLMLELSPSISEDLKERLYTQIQNFIPEDLKIPRRDLLDDLKFFRSSKILRNSSWETETNYRSQSNNKTFDYTNQFRFKRCLIWKSADEVRDALICDRPTLETLSEVTRILQYIGKGIPEYKIGDRYIYQLLQSLGKRKHTYLMVDFKKCGLTFPRELVITGLKAINDVIDSTALQKALEAYTSNPLLQADGVEYNMTNGLGLGMLNELVTIIIVAIFRLGLEDKIFPENTRGAFLGDDQLIYWLEEFNSSTAKEYIEKWESYLTMFGLRLHDEKPFIGKIGHFCEMFTNSPIVTEKRLKQFSTLLNFFDCTNIVQAKEMFSQMYNHWWGLTPEDYAIGLDLAISYWGLEFNDPIERYLPLEFGGWVRVLSDKLNLALRYVDEGLIKPPFQNLWFKVKPRSLESFFNVKKYIEKSYLRGIIDTTEDFDSEFSIKSRIEKLLNKVSFMRLHLDDLKKLKYQVNRYYAQLARLRQQAFKETKETNFLEFLNSREFTNYAIPDSAIYVSHRPRGYIPLWDYKVTPCEDLQRLWLSIYSDHSVRKPFKGDLTSFFQTIAEIEQKEKLMGYNEFHEFILSNNFKLRRFGNDCSLVLRELSNRYDLRQVDLATDPLPYLKYLEDKAIDLSNGKTIVLIPYSKMIFKITLEDFIDFPKRESLYYDEYMREFLKYSLWQRVKPQFEPFGFSSESYWQRLEELAEEQSKVFVNQDFISPRKLRGEMVGRRPDNNLESEDRMSELKEYMMSQIESVNNRLHLLNTPEVRDSVNQENYRTYTLDEMLGTGTEEAEDIDLSFFDDPS